MIFSLTVFYLYYYLVFMIEILRVSIPGPNCIIVVKVVKGSHQPDNERLGDKAVVQ